MYQQQPLKDSFYSGDPFETMMVSNCQRGCFTRDMPKTTGINQTPYVFSYTQPKFKPCLSYSCLIQALRSEMVCDREGNEDMLALSCSLCWSSMLSWVEIVQVEIPAFLRLK